MQWSDAYRGTLCVALKCGPRTAGWIWNRGLIILYIWSLCEPWMVGIALSGCMEIYRDVYTRHASCCEPKGAHHLRLELQSYLSVISSRAAANRSPTLKQREISSCSQQASQHGKSLLTGSILISPEHFWTCSNIHVITTHTLILVLFYHQSFVFSVL